MNPDVFLFTGALGVCLLLLVIAYWLLDRARRRAVTRDRLADARARVGLPAAAVDNVEGTNLADLDECELIFSLPARCPHREELKQRIADDTVLTAAFGLIADGIDYDADLAAFADGLLREIRDEDDHTTNPTGDQT